MSLLFEIKICIYEAWANSVIIRIVIELKKSSNPKHIQPIGSIFSSSQNADSNYYLCFLQRFVQWIACLVRRILVVLFILLRMLPFSQCYCIVSFSTDITELSSLSTKFISFWLAFFFNLSLVLLNTLEHWTINF